MIDGCPSSTQRGNISTAFISTAYPDLKKITLMLFAAFVISACVTPSAPNVEQAQQLARIESSITNLEQSVAERFTAICDAQTQELQGKLKNVEDSLRSEKRKHSKAKTACKTERLKGEKLILGEIEAVYFLAEERTINARVDTGAETSSLGVYKLVEFERDGKAWVRFKLKKTKSAPSYEYPISGRATIKQRDQNTSDDRLEVRMDIRLGDKRFVKQTFNLADRSYLDYQALIGRSFLQDIAIVDTALKHNLKKK